MAQSVERPISAQVMISRSVGSSPSSGSVLTAQSLEAASDSVSPSLSAPLPLMLCLSLSLSLSVKNKQTFKKTEKKNLNSIKIKHHFEGKFKRLFPTIKKKNGGAWGAQSVKHLTSVQVMNLGFVSSSPTSGSVLRAQSLEPASHSVSPSLSAPLPLMLCLSLSLFQK